VYDIVSKYKGFNFENVIAAAVCTENQEFIVWRKGGECEENALERRWLLSVYLAPMSEASNFGLACMETLSPLPPVGLMHQPNAPGDQRTADTSQTLQPIKHEKINPASFCPLNNLP